MKRNKDNYLDYIPVKNSKYNWQQSDNGDITIFVENRGVFHWFAQTLLKKPRISQIHLEEFGSFLWPRIDGEQSIFELGKEVHEAFGSKAEPLYPRLIQYMKNLEDYGFIIMKKPE